MTPTLAGTTAEFSLTPDAAVLPRALMPRYSSKRHIDARPVAGIRSSAGRTAARRPEHYMTKADSRSLNRDLDAALAAIEARNSPAPAHAPQPKVRTRRGMQDLNFRRFADGPL